MSTLQRETLSVGEKIALLRIHNKITQVAFAEEIKAGPGRVSKVENGKGEYTKAQEKAAKILFKIVDLPLSERERVVFRARLYRWIDAIGARDMEEARKICKEMANIENLEPCDFDMVMLCKMIEAYMMIVENDYVSAEKILSSANSKLERMNAENQYHYYMNKGVMGLIHYQPENGLSAFHEANKILGEIEGDLPEKGERLYYNMGQCYSYMEVTSKAIRYFIKAQQLYIDSKKFFLYQYLEQSLSLNYIKANQLDEAKELLDRYLLRAEAAKDGAMIGYALFGFGHFYKKTSNWKLAIENFKESIDYLPSNTDNYFGALFHMIICITKSRSFSKAEDELEIAQAESGNNELWSTYFQALEHFLNISQRMTTINDESSDYIENIAIPYFRKNHDYFIALEFCMLLDEHYMKSRRVMKTVQIKNEIIDIKNWVFQ
ncbi:MAG: helix-turn-helix domain-containing protein [Defluviitaleaceae bacterium]|nr:helix-turn-helix domain-containing protein [Defluviitaleaceae bacterium]